MPDELADALVLVRDAARACVSAFPKGDEGEADAGLTQARGAVQEVFATAERMAANAESDVLWLTEGTDRLPPRLCVAPLQVWGPMRDKLLTDKTVVMTSATLMLGGDFSALATASASSPPSAPSSTSSPTCPTTRCPGPASTSAARSTTASRRSCTSPRHLPPPGRDGLGETQLDEIAELVDAADGRTLGPVLQSPGGGDRCRGDPRAAAAPDHARPGRRAAARAGQAVRRRPAHLPVRHPRLWQGLDVPGETCQLVLIDRIPFPRPDDPLMSARQRAVERAGGNGFMQVAATHAALLLAQGSGRLIRTTTDRGVVAVLDPRLATARYGGFLKASLPPMWPTTDPQVARAALARLASSAPVG